jgi:hypothetical protein
VDITFGGEVFTNEKTSQHLFCYDGRADVRGDGVTANVLAWNEQDVMAFEISDNREQPAAITAVLRMLRAPEVKTAAHTVVSKIENRDGRIVLTQKFTEGDYYCGSVVAIAIVGRKADARTANESEIQLAAEAEAGLTILIASAVELRRKEDCRAALRQLAVAEKKGYVWRSRTSAGGTISGRRGSSNCTAKTALPTTSNRTTPTTSTSWRPVLAASSRPSSTG